MRCSKPGICRVVLDVVLYFSVFIAGILSTYWGIPPPYFQVSCDDPSIKRPYGEETVPPVMLMSTTLVLPFIVMALLEWAVPSPCDVSSPLRQGLRRSFRYLGDLFIGSVFVFFITEISKCSTGEPRPFFWTICAPNVTKEMCENTYVSLTWRDCTNPLGLSKRRLVSAMKSFPSGHASLSVFSSVFMIVYIKQRLWNKCSKLIAPWLQLMFATWAFVCSQSRIWDNRHHWWDVLAGGLLGGVGSLLTLHYLCDWFVRDEYAEKEVITADQNYVRNNSRFSQTSVKRLISTTSENENHNDHRQDNRELTDINGTPP